MIAECGCAATSAAVVSAIWTAEAEELEAARPKAKGSPTLLTSRPPGKELSAAAGPGRVGLQSAGASEAPVWRPGSPSSAGTDFLSSGSGKSNYGHKVPSLGDLPNIVASRQSAQSEVEAILEEVSRHYGVEMRAIGFQKAGCTSFLAERGLGIESVPLKEVDEDSRMQTFDFFRHNLARNLPIIISDARKDVRLHNDPLVTGSPGIRFYAAAPVNFSGGHCTCTLSIASTSPRPEFGLTDATVLEEVAFKVRNILAMLSTQSR